MNAAGGFLGGLLCLMKVSKGTDTPWWDGIRRLGMAIVLPACAAGSIIESVDSIEWTFNTRIALCALLGLTADWTVGWILTTCRKYEGRGLGEVLKSLNLLQWFVTKLNALVGNTKLQDAANQTAKSDGKEEPKP